MNRDAISKTTVAILGMAGVAVCLLSSGCASTKDAALTRDQLDSLHKTKTVLITVNGVDGPRREFFVKLFEEQLKVNGVKAVVSDDKGAATSEYDALISLKCYYVDFGQFDLNRTTDINSSLGSKRATGIGKRISCRFELTHKGLGKLFDGTIQGTTRLAGSMNAAQFNGATSRSDAFSAFLEQNAQQHFDAELKHSQGWLYVLNMKPEA
jgi:hypothetical protein